MSNKYATELVEFIVRSMENIEFKRAKCIKGSFSENGVDVYIEIRKEDEH